MRGEMSAPRAVFLEHSGHALTNLGDVAMLQAAVARLSSGRAGGTLVRRDPSDVPSARVRA